MHIWIAQHGEVTASVGCLCPLQPAHLAAAQASWGDAFRRRRGTGRRDEDALLWERGFLAGPVAESLLPLAHVVVCGERVEGLLVSSALIQPSRIECRSGLLYVRYLATAPWNRNRDAGSGGCQGIGRLLVARAVLDSVARGQEGRVGLHAFAGAERFYDELGFDCSGPDPAHRGLPFYELSRPAAERALAEIGRRLVRQPDFHRAPPAWTAPVTL